MEAHGISLPDALIPYCRELYEQFQAEIEEDPCKRDAIICVADLLRVTKRHALEVLENREQRVELGNTAVVAENSVVEVSLETVDTASPRESSVTKESAPTPVRMEHPLPPRPPPSQVPEANCATKTGTAVKTAATRTPHGDLSGRSFLSSHAPEHQKTVKKGRTETKVAKALQQKEKPVAKAAESLQPSSSASSSKHLTPPFAPRNTVVARKAEDEPCVGDWKCKHCVRWNKLYHEKCRSHDEDRGEDCDGIRSFPDDVLCVQEDDGQHKYNKMGRYKGEWYCGMCELWNFENRTKCRACTTSFTEAEYVMGDDESLEDAPPPPPIPEHRTEAQKRNAFYKTNGRHITPRKKPWN